MPRKSDGFVGSEVLRRISTYIVGQVCKRRASDEEKVQIIGSLLISCNKGMERSVMDAEENPIDFRHRFQGLCSTREVGGAQLFRHSSMKDAMINVCE